MNDFKGPEMERRGFMTLFGKAVGAATYGSAANPAVQLLSSSAPASLKQLIDLLYEELNLEKLASSNHTSLSLKFILAECRSNAEFQTIFKQWAQRVSYFDALEATHKTKLAKAIAHISQEDDLWNALPPDIQQRVDSLLSDGFEARGEPGDSRYTPASTLNERRRIGAAFIEILKQSNPKLFRGYSNDLDELLDEDLWFKVSDVIEQMHFNPSIIGDYGFGQLSEYVPLRDKILRAAIHSQSKAGFTVSEETFRASGIDKHFSSYDEFLKDVNGGYEAREAERKMNELNRLKEDVARELAEDSVMILHAPRYSLKGEFSEGLEESYHLISKDGSALSEELLSTLDFYLYELNGNSRFGTESNYLYRSGNTEIHISDPPRALKVLLDDAMKMKSPPTAAQML